MNKVSKIEWSRANIIIYFQKQIEEEVYLVLNNEKISISDKSNNIIKFNITNANNGNMLEAGNYYLIMNDKRVSVDNEIISQLDDISRVFPYRSGFYATIVTFVIDDNQELILKVDYMMQNRNYKKYLQIAEKKSFFGKLFIIFKKVFFVLCNILYSFLHLFKTKKSVLFLTENANELPVNLKILYRHMDSKKYKLRVFAHNNIANNNKILNYLKELYMIAISEIIVIDNYTPILNIIKVKSKVIQLWHAGVGFKAVGYARFGKEGSPHPYHSGHRKYDLVMLDDEKLIPIYKEVFGLSEDHFVVTGMPRLENYLDEKIMTETLQKLTNMNKLIAEKKVILFSPTYRGENQETAFYDYNKLDLSKIYDFCLKNNFIFIIKMHGFIKEKIDIPVAFQHLIFDYSQQDINELIYISDIMITDYSSCAYEFSLFDRPLIFYRYDKVNYEYKRPIHTLDVFTTKQIEVTNMTDLLKVLNKYKNISTLNRFSTIKKRKKMDSCDIITKEML